MPSASCAASKTARPRRGQWGLPHWSILILAVLFFAGSAGCATRQLPRANVPQTNLTPAQRDGDVLCLRGRLPDLELLTLSAVMQVAYGEAARAECERERADGLVTVHDASNEAWRAYANGEH